MEQKFIRREDEFTSNFSIITIMDCNSLYRKTIYFLNNVMDRVYNNIFL